MDFNGILGSFISNTLKNEQVDKANEMAFINTMIEAQVHTSVHNRVNLADSCVAYSKQLAPYDKQVDRYEPPIKVNPVHRDLFQIQEGSAKAKLSGLGTVGKVQYIVKLCGAMLLLFEDRMEKLLNSS